MEKTKDKFVFEEKTHTYYFDGKKMTGVTTILGVIAKPALIGWAANQAVDYVTENTKFALANSAITIDLDKFEKILQEARKAHLRKRDKAADAGTDVHAICEEIIKNSIQFSEGEVRTGKNPNPQVQHFIDWAIKNKVKFLDSEKKVYDEELFVAGTYDFKCEIADKTYIADIKTSSGIYDRTPFAQTAAYQMLELKNEPENKIDGRLIINLKKDGTFKEEKDVYFSYDFETDKELFLAALKIYRTLKNY